MSQHYEGFQDFAEKARQELGGSLKEMILYGSVARGEESERSDVDVFALVETKDDLERLQDLAFDIGVLKHEISINVQGDTVERFEGFSSSSYLRNIKKEGESYA